MENGNKQIDLDILRKVEELSNKVNGVMATMSHPLLKRYPLTFMFFILIGVVAVSEGVKGIITEIPFFDGHPWRLLLAGIIVLVATGTLYKNLKN